MNERSIMEAHCQRVAGAVTTAGVALTPGRHAEIAAQLAGTLAACAPLRDALRFEDDPDAWHAAPWPLPSGVATGKAADPDASTGVGT